MKNIPEKWAKINIIAIGIFYVISGSWEYLVGLTQEESIPLGAYFLLDVYRKYLEGIGVITILIGIGILCGVFFRLKFIRFLALILAWWNLFTAPIIEIWWSVYSITVKKFSTTDSWLGLWLHSLILIAIMTVLRLYIIDMLKISKAGFIFLKKRDH